MKKYYKLPIPVVVKFAEQSGEIRTLEGVVKYKRDDAILTGVSNEQWPVERNKFEKSYLPIPPIKNGENGLYIKSKVEVCAYQLDSPISLEIKKDTLLQGNAGDWLISDSDGNKWIVENKIFHLSYAEAT